MLRYSSVQLALHSFSASLFTNTRSQVEQEETLERQTYRVSLQDKVKVLQLSAS